MSDDLPAPKITLRDPDNPDLLASGEERPPWRPSRMQLKVLLGIVLVLLAAVPPTLLLQQRNEDREADRKALASVYLEFTDLEGRPALLNTGGDPVTVLTARVDGRGQKAVDLGERLERGERTPFTLPFEPTSCPRSVAELGPAAVVLHVRTHRGDERDVRVSLGDTVLSAEYVEKVKEHCGLYLPEESLEMARALVDVAGRTLEIDARLFNRSVQRREITALRLPGFAVRTVPRLPLAVPQAAQGRSGDLVPIRVLITVTDCDQAAISDGSEHFAVFELQAEVNGSEAYLHVGADLPAAIHELLGASC